MWYSNLLPNNHITSGGNSYGIGKFDKEFDFSNENMFLIYAQNGIFKTSFAKTLKDIIDGKTPKDNIFNKRMSNANIKIDNNNPTKDNLIIKIYHRL